VTCPVASGSRSAPATAFSSGLPSPPTAREYPDTKSLPCPSVLFEPFSIAALPDTTAVAVSTASALIALIALNADESAPLAPLSSLLSPWIRQHGSCSRHRAPTSRSICYTAPAQHSPSPRRYDHEHSTTLYFLHATHAGSGWVYRATQDTQ
jgi:hypothetical protein